MKMRQSPSPREIHKAIPNTVRHLFMQLMPYGARAPAAFKELQLGIYSCFTAPTADAKATALLELCSLFDQSLWGVHNPKELLVEIASIACEQAYSYIAAELLLVAKLDAEGVTIDETYLAGRRAGVPALQGMHPRYGDERVIAGEAGELLGKAMLRMTGTDAAVLRAMPAPERLAALRLLRLYSLYGAYREVAAGRLRFFEMAGVPLWRLLSEDGFAGCDHDPDMYGEPSINRMLLALRGADEEGGDGQKADPRAPAETGAPVAKRLELGPLEHLVIREEFPATRDSDEKAIFKQHEVLRRPLPIARIPEVYELDAMRSQLVSEFPWAQRALDTIFSDLRFRRMHGSVRLWIRPTLFVGPAGSGKTRLAHRIAEVLSLPQMTMRFGGMTDSMSILGTARGWSSAQPSPLLKPLLSGTATAAIILDEIDKSANTVKNSPAVPDALLPFLEPADAAQWRDVFLQVNCDVSPLIFLLTANATTWLPDSFMSRLRVLRIDRPSKSQLLAIVPYVVADLEREMGLPAGALAGVPVLGLQRVRLYSTRALRAAVRASLQGWLSEPGRMTRH